MALVVGSIFYNLPNTTDSLYSRGALLFFGILLAAFASALDVCQFTRYSRSISHQIDHDAICTKTYCGEA